MRSIHPVAATRHSKLRSLGPERSQLGSKNYLFTLDQRFKVILRRLRFSPRTDFLKRLDTMRMSALVLGLLAAQACTAGCTLPIDGQAVAIATPASAIAAAKAAWRSVYDEARHSAFSPESVAQREL